MVQFHVNNVQDQLDYRHLCVRSSSCMEGTWVDGHLHGRVITDNEYGGFEVIITIIILISDIIKVITVFE